MSATRKAVLKHMMTAPMDLTEKDLPWQWAQSMGLSKISSLVSLKDVTPHATFKDSGGDEQTYPLARLPTSIASSDGCKRKVCHMTG